ncbi:MAG: hypothetical protein Q4C47_07585, partial [Planctomycetia bacterium]|nr:hypothetical protein [Planctomycetia bacterium]
MNDIEMVVSNPFGGAVTTGESRATAIAERQVSSRETALVQSKIFLAKQFPRNPVQATERILTSCQRIGLASVSTYAYAKGGSNISGPSIRLAEEIARQWGNMEVQWEEIERTEKESIVRAYAWDLETNCSKSIVFHVPLQRTTRSGTTFLKGESEIYEAIANYASRRLRNCILAIIPGDVVEAAVEQCQRTMVSTCDITPDRINAMVTQFSKMGVTKSQIERRIQRKLTAIEPAQFLRMMEIYRSLRDGMSEVNDWFDPESETERGVSATEGLKKRLLSSEPG